MSNISQNSIRNFLLQKTFALAGVSRRGTGYGCLILHHLLQKGYEVLPIHPEASAVEGIPCYPSLSSLPKPIDGLILVVPPDQTEDLVREADIVGIRLIWMQPGAESEDAVTYCEERCIEVIHGGPCLLVLA